MARVCVCLCVGTCVATGLVLADVKARHHCVVQACGALAFRLGLAVREHACQLARGQRFADEGSAF